MKLIGFSLTFCVADMIYEKVDPDSVVAIYAQTKCSTREQFRSLFLAYSKTYWNYRPRLAAEIALDLWDTGRIIQPRLGKNPEVPLDPSQMRWAILQEEPWTPEK